MAARDGAENTRPSSILIAPSSVIDRGEACALLGPIPTQGVPDLDESVLQKIGHPHGASGDTRVVRPLLRLASGLCGLVVALHIDEPPTTVVLIDDDADELHWNAILAEELECGLGAFLEVAGNQNKLGV